MAINSPSAARERVSRALDELAQLPVLSSSVQRVLALADEPDSTVGELVDAIGADEGLAANMLRLANSAQNARPVGARTIRQAVTVIGRRGVRRLALEAVTYRFLEGAPGVSRSARGELHVHALSVARIAAALAERAGAPADTPHLAGLLHDVGKLVLAPAFGEETLSELVAAHPSGGARARAERQALGIDHAEAGRMLAERWELPSEVTSGIAWHHGGPTGLVAPGAAEACVQLANAVAGMLSGHAPEPALVDAASARLGLSGEDLDAAVQEATGSGGHADSRSLAGRVNELERLARLDDLTGLANRRQWIAETRQILGSDGGGSLLLCDVDGFKAVNDRYGHQVGDLVLMEVARVVSRHGRAGRLGGDEFAVWVSGTAADAERTAALLISETAAAFPAMDGRPTVSLSVGIAIAPGHGGDVSELLDRADEALYAAKDRGKSQSASAA